MKKLIIFATALSLLNPLPIFGADEEMDEVIPCKEAEFRDDQDLKDHSEFEELLSWSFELVTKDDEEKEKTIYYGRVYDQYYFSYPVSPQNYFLEMVPNLSSILEEYMFVEALPDLRESDFKVNPSPVKIQVIKRSSANVSSIDSLKPVLFVATYSVDGQIKDELNLEFSSASEIDLTLSGSNITVNEGTLNAQIQKQNSALKLVSSSLDSSQLIPVMAGTELVAYILKGDLQCQSFEDLKDSLVEVWFQYNDSKDAQIFRIPLKVLCTSISEDNTYKLDENTAQRIANYLSEIGWGLPSFMDTKPEDYRYTIKIDDLSSIYDLDNPNINIKGEIKSHFTSNSYINIGIYIEGLSEELNKSLTYYFSPISSICDNDLKVSKKKLQDFIKEYWGNYKIDDTKFQSIDFNQPQLWTKDDRFGYKVYVSKLSETDRNNTEFSLNFWDNTIQISATEKYVARKWKD